MSTRSGKRIHSTAFEHTDTVDSEVVPKTEKRTRKQRLKENEELQEFAVPKSKTQKHYVGYPSSSDEGGYTTASDAVDGIRSARKSKKNTLKEHDINVPEIKNNDDHDQAKQNGRITRKTRRFVDNVEEVSQNADTEATEETPPSKKVKGKKNKKRKSKNSDINENISEPLQAEEAKVVSKKSKKKKKGKQGNVSTEELKQTLNRSNVSTDSFHSAAGSPLMVTEEMDDDKSPKPDIMETTLVNEYKEPEIKNVIKTRRKSSLNLKSTTPKQAVVEPELTDTLKKESKIKRMSSSQNTIAEKEEFPSTSNDINSTYDKIDVESDNKPNTSVGKKPKARRSLRINNSIMDTLTDATNVEISEKLNVTCEKETKSETSLSNSSENGTVVPNTLNTTFEKVSNKNGSRVISLDSTYDKSDPKLNTTFDKIETKINSAKSSLISSDEGTVNVTFDKDTSRISITSDDSKTENIVNTTPLLIESSMDESQLTTSKTSESLNVTKDKVSPTPNRLQPPITPLKREGTFTKESPDIKTPTQRLTLPSPGLTPFHITRSPNKEKSMLNVTRSIERSRRSSLADLAPSRQTRVMFCSPMNNPAVVSQQKKTVIKSSMKGSNKSFVFDESASSVVRPPARKRSYTHNDADDTRVKRKRLADDIQNSVNRLSRPRTSSATGKLPDTTPSKKAPTPSKLKSEPKRTKLPNFAALHQKQFDKMESLDECQRRKMKRAKKLLIPKTPNGTVVVLERSSPRGIAEQTKPKEVTIKKPETPAKKSETPAQKPITPAKKSDTPNIAEQSSKLTKLPASEMSRPGFTRFGFKINTDINPFSIPSITVTKTKTNPEKPNGLTVKPSFAPKTTVKPLSRPATLPSKAGTTTVRKEAARQTVMREKLFTSGKRDVKRNENRTIIKGVRTNRRFELQMQMRNID